MTKLLKGDRYLKVEMGFPRRKSPFSRAKASNWLSMLIATLAILL